MGAILLPADYPAIRAKLGIDLSDLPDADIETVGILPVAEAMIKALVTNYASLTGDNQTFVKASTVCLAGALACGALEMRRGQAFGIGSYRESETKVDWANLRESLLCESKKYMLLITTLAQGLGRRKLFATSGPTSAATTWPNEVERWYARVQPDVLRWLQDGGALKFGWENMP